MLDRTASSDVNILADIAWFEKTDGSRVVSTGIGLQQ